MLIIHNLMLTYYIFSTAEEESGESIWEIKKRIGYISPEMHLFYREDIPVIRVVSSGFFDSVGVFRACTKSQEETAWKWMAVLV